MENKKKIDEFIATSKDYIKKLECIIERNQSRRRINDQIDLIIDDFIELLGELRSTKKPLTKEKRDYFLNKLEKRRQNLLERGVESRLA